MTDKLTSLRQLTTVVADTGDIAAMKLYQPQDATTNPSLILNAAQIPEYRKLIDEAIGWARQQSSNKEEQLAQVQPHPALLDRADDLLAREPADLALAPEPALGRAAHVDQAVMLARVAVDQVGQRRAGEERGRMQPVRQPQRLMPPQGGMLPVPVGEYRVLDHALTTRLAGPRVALFAERLGRHAG